MNRALPLLALGALGALAAGCATTEALQYDHSRCYEDVMRLQSDLSRPSAIGAAYAMGGAEALQIRMLSEQASTDQETTEAQSTATFDVQ